MSTIVPTGTPNHAVWGLTATILWALLIAAVWVATYIGAAFVFIGVHYEPASTAEFNAHLETLERDDVFLSITLFATLLVSAPLILGIVKLKKYARIRPYLALNTVSAGALKYWLGCTIALIVISDVLTLSLGKPLVPEAMTTLYASARAPLLLTLAIVLAAPLLEELFFRGFLMMGLSKSIIGPIGAVLVSAALWAAMHTQYDTYGIATIFVFGLVLGVARLTSNSVWLTIAMHAFANIVASVQTWFYVT